MTRKSPDQLSIPPDGRPYHDQPQWRNDFPVDVPQDELVARRDFTKFLVLTSLAFVVGQSWIAVENFSRRRRGEPEVKKVANLEDIPIGGSMVFAYPGEHDKNVLIRLGYQRFIAYNQKCTHLGCAVVPEPDKNRLLCPCHNGAFDLVTGRPTQGPPRRPLPKITLEIRDNVLYATGVEVRSA
jgi:Rieske Fe-S protein